MRAKGLMVSLAIVCLASGAAVTVGGTARAGFPGSQGRIAFASDRDGDYEIYTMKPNGTGVVKLTRNDVPDLHPAWNAAGTKIVFVSARAGNGEIYKMNADGSNVVRLTSNAVSDGRPAWSPNGRQIVFQRFRNNDIFESEIYKMKSDGTGQTRLTNNAAIDTGPVWSPDGTRIAFEHFADPEPSQDGIFLMGPDGSGMEKLVDNGVNPDWSPDSRRIVYAGQGAVICIYCSDIFVINVATGRKKNLTNNDTDTTTRTTGSRRGRPMGPGSRS